MGKSPRDLDDDELISRLRDEEKQVNISRSIEENAPVDIEDPPVELDVDGVRED